jgi:AraC family transcriptional regulator
MGNKSSVESADAFQSAFGVSPRFSYSVGIQTDAGVFGWTTPAIEGFALPPSNDLVIALHLGGSNRVRAITSAGPSRNRSTPGRITVLPPELGATFATDGPVSLVSLHIPHRMVSKDWLRQPHFAFEDEYASAAMSILSKLSRRPRPASQDYLRSITDALLRHLHDRCDEDTHVNHEDRFDRLLAYLEANLGERHTLGSMAEHCTWSPSRVTRAFRARGEASPHQYLIRRRVERAKALIKDQDLSSAYIAHEVGFSSQSHFVSIFRSTTGLTPGEYKRQSRS